MDHWDFFNTLNNYHESIKLKTTTDRQLIDFLDITSYKYDNFRTDRIIDSKVFLKPTDSHQLLHKMSFHPKHTFQGVIKLQFHRFFRIWNIKSDWIWHAAFSSNHYKPEDTQKDFFVQLKPIQSSNLGKPSSLKNNNSCCFRSKTKRSICKHTSDY